MEERIILDEVELLPCGIYFDYPASKYHRLPYASNSYLGKLDYCPAHAQLPSKTTKEMVFGRAFHTFTMEPHLFKEEFYSIDSMLPANSSLGRRQRANAILDNTGKELIPATGDDSLETLVGMKRSILTHPSARRLISDCWYEVTLIWDYTLPNGKKLLTRDGKPIRMKARVDAIPKRASGIMVDLKSCKDCSPVGFLRSLVDLGYYRQAAIYLDALNTLFRLYTEQGREFPFPTDFDTFIFIAVEKKGVYRCECHDLTPRFYELGQNEYHRLLEVERSCREAKGGAFYPAYRNAGVNTLDVPLYLRPQV